MNSLFQNGFLELCGINCNHAGPNGADISVEIKDCHLNPMGSAHGGIICTLLDTAAGFAAIYSDNGPRKVCTQCADIHFLKPLYRGTATAHGSVIKAGGRVAVATANLYNEEGILTATGTFDIFYQDAITADYIAALGKLMEQLAQIAEPAFKEIEAADELLIRWNTSVRPLDFVPRANMRYQGIHGIKKYTCDMLRDMRYRKACGLPEYVNSLNNLSLW